MNQDSRELKLERAKDAAFRAVLATWSISELLDILNPSNDDIIDLMIENEVFTDHERDAMLKREEFAEIRREHLLSDELELGRLCGGAKSPEEEMAFYKASLQQ